VLPDAWRRTAADLASRSAFADADEEPMPDMLVPLDWQAVKQFFYSQVPRLL
jgi:hypothetical protein